MIRIALAIALSLASSLASLPSQQPPQQPPQGSRSPEVPSPEVPSPEVPSPEVPARAVTARSIPLPGVRGRIDHLAYDAATGRLFVAALGNGSLEVVDVERGEVVGHVGDLPEPQGVAVVPATAQVVVACGGDGTLRAFACATLQPRGRLRVGADADNLRLCPDGATLLVGEGDGSLAVVGAAGLDLLGRVPLPGHPESFQVDPGGDRAWVNVPGARPPCVVAVDLAERRVDATWPLPRLRANYPMALDAARRQLLVACRAPACLCVLDAGSGGLLAQVDCVGDADDVFVDGDRVLVVGGGGRVDVFARHGGGCQRVTELSSAAGARTGLWLPALHRLFIAAPRRGAREAEIRELDLGG
jgi:hypothetical protein